jgi:hypothetical protein
MTRDVARSSVRALRLALLAVLLLVLLPGWAVAAGERVTGTPLQLLGRLTVATERPRGYDSDKFPHWRNADGDGCDTRAEVLIAESLTSVSTGSGCTIRGGRWRSAYDGVTTRKASTLDVDHVVALKEAWESGARGWTESRRQAYANDLGDPRTLRAVTASTNRSKSGRSPDEWMPPRAGIACRYLGWWVAIKVRWRLSVDRSERDFIRSRLRDCPAPTLSVRRA